MIVDGPKILVIDDNKDNLVSLGAMLRTYLPGCEVATAESGEKGIEGARAGQPDTILLDIQMPGMNGFEVCRALKVDPQTRRIPVIFLTAQHTDPASRIRGLEIGGDAFLTKPVEPGELMAQIRAMVRIKQAEDALRGEKSALERLVARRTAALEQSQERFKLLFEKAPVGYQSLDIDGRFLEVNETWLAMLGYTRGEVVGRWFGDFLDPGYQDHFRANFPRFKAAGEIMGVEFRMVRKDGSSLLVSFNGKIGTDEGGRFTQTHCVLSDITEQRKAEEGLRESEERFRSVTQSASDAIVTADSSGVIVTWNPAATRMFGYSEAEVMGQPLAMLMPERFRPPHDGAMNRLAIGGEGALAGLSAELAGVRKGGEEFPLELSVSTWESSQGRFHTGIIRDITERKRSEEALRASEERYRLIVMSSSDGIFSLDLEGRITFVSPHWLQKGGYAEKDVIGRHLTDLLPEEYREIALEKFTRGLAGAEIPVYEVEILVSDGSRMPAEISMSNLTDGAGEVVGRLGVLRDITERKRAEQALAHSRAQLQQSQKLEAVGRLAGGVAHDFNNILQALLSLATVLKLKAATPELTKIVEEIEAHVKRGAGLTKQLLLFSRRQASEKAKLDLAELTGTAAGMLRRLIPENIRLTLDTTPGKLWVDGDAGQLQQVLMNLAVNARDAMPNGGTLTVRTRGRRGEAVIEVVDTGHGMDEETRSHLFEPFFTTKEPGKGTGLGLSVVHGIVEQHGGRIEVESAPGEGSCFRLVLPSVPAPDEAATARAAEAELPRGHGERVLVVEDEEGARRGLTELLIMLGYEVVAAGSGEEASSLPEVPTPDILLTDLMLPGIDGAALAVDLRKRWPDLKVVLMSGYTEDEAVRRGIDEGTVHFLQKPFDMAALAGALARTLRAERPARKVR